MIPTFTDIGVVVIGRNEGVRLKRCLNSVLNQVGRIVYVDSGSSDGSVDYAESIKIEVVRLDMSIPFTAARARNEGFNYLVKKHDQLKYIQFIDGDCELLEGWVAIGIQFLESNSTCAIVAGRTKERHPEQSIYNLLCDIEWNIPAGETEVCGGIFMIRRRAFEQVKGFNPTIVAGEEPELCYRLRKNNWSIFRLDNIMTLHDAAITSFSQWWTRTVRTGHAYAQNYTLHAHEGHLYCFNESAKSWFWAFIFPAIVLILTLTININFLILFTIYFILFVKIFFNMYKRTANIKHTAIYTFFNIIGKWPQLIGQLIFIKRILFNKNISIIEYK
ncbi:MAG: glycosyltransferase family 2 protein [Desulfobulbaceae bacterium]